MGETAAVRNPALRSALQTFAEDAAVNLTAETLAGAEIPFEVTDSGAGAGRAPLYCYRPLTQVFIRDRLELLAALASYAPAVRALSGLEGLQRYLDRQGVRPASGEPRVRAVAALRAFLEALFEGRSDFSLDPDRFQSLYQDLEWVVYEGRGVSIVITPVLGLALSPQTAEVPLAEDLVLMRAERLKGAPAEAVWGPPELDAAPEPSVLAVLTLPHDAGQRPPVAVARGRFRRILTTLRLFERGAYALGPLAWVRADQGTWRPVALGTSGRSGVVTLLAQDQEDELRTFANLVARRVPGRRGPGTGGESGAGGELGWALSRFEMGCERSEPSEALTDYLLALRALLEPEGPHSGRVAQRLAVLCARPEQRRQLAERVAQAISLERAVIGGLPPAETGIDVLATELSECLRALLRDVVCGHLDVDLRSVADDLLAEVVETVG